MYNCRLRFIGAVLFLLFGFNVLSHANNPLVKGFGMADPHVYIFNNKAYLFTTRDSTYKVRAFIMPDWHIWSSDDLIHWKHERTIYPTETYIGKSTSCWATETATKNGKYYFYFSHGNMSTGVLVADKPEGPYKDVLKKPVLPSELSPGREYDPTVLIDDDGKAYIVYGHYKESDPDLKYYIVRLNEDMISLAETPKVIGLYGHMLPGMQEEDKPYLHKHNGLYYLSQGSFYSTSKNVYGPYQRRGNSGNGKYGFNGRAHGNYFKWKNQWFHTWCHFFMGKSVALYRESYMTYLHYRKNGEMVSDTVLLDNHFENGVGQYDADWNCIQSEWFMAASKEDLKNETSTGGFAVSNMKSGDYIYFPNVSNLKTKSQIAFALKAFGNGSIEIRQDKPDGRLIGECKVKPDGRNTFTASIRPEADKMNLYLVFKGKDSFCEIDSFSFR